MGIPSPTIPPLEKSVRKLDDKIRIAVLFQRFGPYHHARLNAAGRMLSVWGVEACAMEETYAWNKVEGAGTFTRITLTDRDTGDRLWERELQQKMWRALDEIKPEVVAINGWSAPDALNALWWCVKNSTPVVIMSESTAWDEQRVPWKEWIKGRLVKLCSAGLAGGTPHADYLAKLGLKPNQIFTGYDIVDNEYFAKAAEAARKEKVESRTKYGLPEKYFLASARFIEKKNLFRLLKAYAQYRDLAGKINGANQNSAIWDLVLLGDGPLRSSIFDLRTSLGLETCVHMPGFKQYDELPAFFGLAGAFVHPSTTEQWGLVVNEAMASGLPVLVSNRCGCAQDLVRDGVNGFNFVAANVEELAGLMSKISGSGFPLSEYGLQSQHIIANWGPNRFADGLRNAATTALELPRPRIGMLDKALLRLVHMSVIANLLKN